jgi:alpha-mannosidase
MRRRARILSLILPALLLTGWRAWAQAPRASSVDLARQPTLYVVGYAHLDTQWRWDYVETIGEYIPNTMYDNFALFEKYPHYIFNFSGANRYRMMKEYYPSDFAKVQKYVAAGRWFPSGAAMEESDVNVPSAESIIRQILYGSHFFRRELGRSSAEYMLPDCFGFPASLPSILAHAGIKGFSTQKLTWRSANGIPFNVGVWEGLDGKSVIAALNAGDYGADIKEDLSRSESWLRRIQQQGMLSGVYADYLYYGTGDIGGAPREPSVRLLEQIVTKGRAALPNAPGQETPVGVGPIQVLSATAEQMFLDITPEQAVRLPRYRGDLLLIEHSAGSLSSQTYMKRWNRRNEVLADAAERDSVAAHWLGGRDYPLERLNNAWTLVAGAQFHDILPGTSIPKAYEYSWNDEVLAMNQFAGVLNSATEAVASAMNTQATGKAIVVYNPLNIAREDVVEASVRFPGGVPQAVRVVGPDGREVPAQMASIAAGAVKVLFLAKVPPVGFAVYDLQVADSAPSSAAGSTLQVTEDLLEGERYRVRLDPNGDVASIYDKKVQRELLSGPARLAFQTEKPFDWPAWNMDWSDQQKPPRGYVSGPAKVRIVEKGPARIAIEVSREAEGSRFVQTIRLAAGDAGNRVEFANRIDWKTASAALKATFPLTASNPEATYHWDIGTIQRGNNNEKKYEVPSHQWFDLTDQSGAFGVTVLSDCKYGSDKPDDNTLRLTLLYTPGIGGGNAIEYNDQSSQDWGHHEFVYGLAGHAGDWRREQSYWQALRLNQPLLAFETPRHAGALGTAFSLLKLSTNRLRVLALKKAEQGEEFVIRLVETEGKPVEAARIAFAGSLTAAREVNGQEMPVGRAAVKGGELVADFAPYQVRSFAVMLGTPPVKLAAPTSRPVALPYDRSVASMDHAKSAGGFDDAGRSLPGEMLPRQISYGGINFHLAPVTKPNAVTAKGQTIALPSGQVGRILLLAASAAGDQKATFRIGEQATDLTIQDWSGYIGQWDRRSFREVAIALPPEPAPDDTSPAARLARRLRSHAKLYGPLMRAEVDSLAPGYIKPAPVAWFASHRHTAAGANEIYAYSYLYAYSLEVPPGATSLTLPVNDKIRILAVTATEAGGAVRPVQELCDVLRQPEGDQTSD